MCRPRSITSVFRPRSHNSLATQPPLIPEPTTIASKSMSFRRRSDRRGPSYFAQGQARTPRAGHELEAQFFGGADFRLVVAEQHEVLELPVRHVLALQAFRIERTHHFETLLGGELEECSATPAPGFVLDAIEHPQHGDVGFR